MLFHFPFGGRKGGPAGRDRRKSGFQPSVRLAPRAVPQARDCAGREAGDN
jgi:hypothetical protein